MSADYYQRIVNNLDKEIAEFEKKKANKDKEIANLQMKISSIQKSITKNTSESMLNSKLRQINSYENDIVKKSKESADLNIKIADKRKKRNDAYIKFQNEQQKEIKKQETNNKKLLTAYQSRIESLQNQLEESIKPTKLSYNDSNEEYDVFISHAFEDKEDFVDEFVSELREQGLKVWYDTDKLKWGDSMREKIDKGLSKSRYGVVILSPNYISENKYWTKAELNGLFQVETINGKTILPIWHNLTKKQVTEYSPIIADRKAMTTASMTAKEIAVELKELFVPRNKEED